jgi:cell filamentation protein
MSGPEANGSYTYPNQENQPDKTDVLRNKFGIRRQSELRAAEYAATDRRQTEIFLGKGPAGKFDKEHLKALHRHIFQDVYEWAGHTRNESPMVDGRRVEPVGMLSKGGMPFLPGSRIEMGLDEAFKPISDLRAEKLQPAEICRIGWKRARRAQLCAPVSGRQRPRTGSIHF